MKLRNKISGEIKEFSLFDGKELQGGATLENLTKEWEDVPEEPKERWYINENGGVMKYVPFDPDGEDLSYMKYQNEIGNYFETKEEAEKAVEKLKAWKRLKDKGISFEVKVIDRKWCLELKAETQQRTFDEIHDLFKDIMFVFEGEE